jgi:hypothetical protein
MSQIELRVLKQGLETPNVISASFFTMTDAYRKFEQYIANLKNFCKLSAIPGFCTRIYTDDSGQEVALQVAGAYSHVSVIHFNCPEFRENVGHVGTFGTIVRFLPLFEKGLDLVWVSDIDIPAEYLNSKRVQNMDNVGAQVSFITFLCYQNKPYGRKYTILAGTILSRITFPKQMLTRFLNKVLKEGFNDTIDKLNEVNKIKNKVSSKFPYGTDEIFTNTSFYDYIVRHDIKCLVPKDYSRAGVYLGFNGLLSEKEKDLFVRYYRTLNPDYVPKLKQIIKTKLPELVPQYPCLQEVLDVLPQLRTSLFKSYVVTGKELD